MRIGIVGYGNIARKHIEVFRDLGCDIVASANRSEAGRRKAREESRIPETFADHTSLAKKAHPDAMVICVTFDQIFSVTADLMKHQIPLLVEKPPGTSLAELRELIRLQHLHNTKVQVALNRRHYTVFNKALDEVGGRQNISFISVEWSENPVRVRDQKGFTDQQIGKIIYGNSIHGIDLMTYLAGDVCDYTISSNPGSAYFSWNMVLNGKSPSGSLVCFLNSWDSPIGWRVVLGAKRKRYVFAPLEKCVVTDSENKSYEISPSAEDITFKAGFYGQAKHFLDFVSDKTNGECHNLQSCVKSMEIAEAFYNLF